MEPTFRIVAVPTKPTENLINTTNKNIWDLLKNPPQLRPNGFGFRGVDDVMRIQGGCSGDGIAQQKITVLKNGFIELTTPLLNRHFQWYRSEKNLPVENWLYPFTMFEMPLAFILLSNKLFYLSGYHGSFLIQQDYYFVKNFALVPGHPASPFFGHYKDEIQTYSGDHIIGDKYESQVLGSAWETNKNLVLEVYQSFSYSTENVPRLKELEGYSFSFDYEDFYAKYKYKNEAILVEIVNYDINIKWSYEVPIDQYPNEIKAIEIGIDAYKKEVQEKGQHPNSK